MGSGSAVGSAGGGAIEVGASTGAASGVGGWGAGVAGGWRVTGLGVRVAVGSGGSVASAISDADTFTWTNCALIQPTWPSGARTLNHVAELLRPNSSNAVPWP